MKVMFSLLFVCLSTGFTENYPTDFLETWWKDVLWAHEEPIKQFQLRERTQGLFFTFINGIGGGMCVPRIDLLIPIGF